MTASSEDNSSTNSEELMQKISLFGRYQGSEQEDQVLKDNWQTLNLPEEYQIRWLRSTDFKKGYGQLKVNLDERTLPEDAVFSADNELSFKRMFKSIFPNRRTNLKMLVIT